MIANKVKLVIWDLDDTFWSGTLAEEGIVPIARNAEMVIELSKRGIVNSICSKNDRAAAKAQLIEQGVWDYFVFPAIGFNPKGKAIAQMIEGAALRPENVLFIDDNTANLEEAKFFNPGIMTAHPADVLEELLEHPHLEGKPDPELTRLEQYRFLQKKVEERAASTLSNEEFLRASNIRVRIDHDAAANFERVVELINRTNQLNYTKKRLATGAEVEAFRDSLAQYGNVCGCVFAADDYGDYGLIGFFLLRKRANGQRLIHFAFSCRTMHMGIEQYVYDMLGRPEIEIASPVSYGLETHAKIDWINTGGASEADAIEKVGKLVLLGGCDMLQLASYLSADRLEFVNRMEGEMKVRYDDPGFITGDREAIKRHQHLLPNWSYDDALRFDEGIATADLVILCLWAGLNGRYFEVGGEIKVRLSKPWTRRLKERDPALFREQVKEIELDKQQRLNLILRSFDEVASRCKEGARIVVIGAALLRGRRQWFNDSCREFCATRPEFLFLDVNQLIGEEAVPDTIHYTPAGYHKLARHIVAAMRGARKDADERDDAVAAAAS